MPVYNRYYLVNGKFGRENLRANGPRLSAQLDIPQVLSQALTTAGQPLPQPQRGVALVDTGASISAVDVGAIAQLGVPPVGQVNVLTPSGQAMQDVYPFRVSFPGSTLPTLDFTRATGAQLAAQGLIVLIGRDVLDKFVLVYNGPGGHISLSY